MGLLRVTEPFQVFSDGRTFHPGDLVDENDPVVTPGRLRFFGPVETSAPAVQVQPAIEEATAEPGSRRSRSRKAPATTTSVEQGSAGDNTEGDQS